MRKFFFFFLFSIAYANEYSIAWDMHFSPFAGGEDLLYATRIAERAEEFYFRRAYWEDSKSASARWFRLSEMLTIWLPENYEIMLIGHEVFGHGYRVRSLPQVARVDGYQLGCPPPYGNGGGATSYSISSQLTSSEEMAIASAGVESTAILANLIKWKWLENRMLDAKQSILYLLCQQDLSEYISSMKIIASHHEIDMSGHDIHSWRLWLNRTYPQKPLSCGKLCSLAWINILDPFSFYSLWAWCHYISSGRDTKIPMIPFYDAGYLFSARLGLTPFGPEIFWENYFSLGGRMFYGYLKAGRHAYNTYVGAGIYLPSVWQVKKWAFGLRADVWRQPQLLLSPGSIPLSDIDDNAPLPVPLYPDSQQHRMRLGASLSGTVAYRMDHTFGFMAEIGGKSEGFLPGYSLFDSGLIRLSFLTDF